MATAERLARSSERVGRPADPVVGRAWIDLPLTVGDRLGAVVLGAAPGPGRWSATRPRSTSTSSPRPRSTARPGATRSSPTATTSPPTATSLEGLAAARGLTLRVLDGRHAGARPPSRSPRRVDERTALVMLSHVAYRSGALADMAAITAARPRRRRARAVGPVPLRRRRCRSSSTPAARTSPSGAPTSTSTAGRARRRSCTCARALQAAAAPADLGLVRAGATSSRWAPATSPRPAIERFLAGTPPVLGAGRGRGGRGALAEAGIERLRAKGDALTELAIELADAWLAAPA